MTSIALTAPHSFATMRPNRRHEPNGPILDRTTKGPCLGLALVLSGMFWAGFGSAILLLA
jgi:hypothetical protein